MDADWSTEGPLHSENARTAAVRLAAREAFDLANTVAVLLYSSIAHSCPCEVGGYLDLKSHFKSHFFDCFLSREDPHKGRLSTVQNTLRIDCIPSNCQMLVGLFVDQSFSIKSHPYKETHVSKRRPPRTPQSIFTLCQLASIQS